MPIYPTMIAALIMLCLLPLAPLMATAAAAPLYTHFTYMLAHANLWHWAINAWGLLLLNHLVTLPRVTVAYLISAGISFIPINEGRPLLGASVVVCFFIGLTLPALHRRKPLIAAQTVILIIIGCLIPGIAALHHIVMLLAGIIYRPLERITCDAINFISH